MFLVEANINFNFFFNIIVTVFYFNQIFGFKLVILHYFFFVHGEINLTYLLTFFVENINK